MKKFAIGLIVSLLAFASAPAWAQWPATPSNPLSLADSAVAQTAFEAVDDGAGGFYYFWIDTRHNNHYEIYGQHLGPDGTKHWPAAGKRVVNARNNVWELDAIRTVAGQTMIAFTVGPNPDSLYAITVDDAGNETGRTLVDGRGPGNSLIYANTPQLAVRDRYTLIGYYGTYVGGAGFVSVNGIRPDLSLVDTNTNGLRSSVGSGGTFSLRKGPGRKEWLIWRDGNGSGTGMTAQRYNLDSLRYEGPVVPLATGTGGLSYLYSVVSDDIGGFIAVFEGAGSPRKLTAFRIDSSGQQAWATPFHYIQDGNGGDGNRPDMLRYNGVNYITWADTRPPVQGYNIYVQAIDDNGTALWPANGIEALQYSSYIPYPKLIGSDSGSVIVVATMNPGTFAMRVRANSTLGWDTASTLIDNPHEPFYQLFTLQNLRGAHMMAWLSFTNKVYATRFTPQGNLTATKPVADGKLNVWPNPAGNLLYCSLPSGYHGPVQVLDAQGRMVLNERVGSGTLPLRDLPPGLYTLQAGPYRARFSKE